MNIFSKKNWIQKSKWSKIDDDKTNQKLTNSLHAAYANIFSLG